MCNFVLIFGAMGWGDSLDYLDGVDGIGSLCGLNGLE